jgi:hypothetical protein
VDRVIRLLTRCAYARTQIILLRTWSDFTVKLKKLGYRFLLFSHGIVKKVLLAASLAGEEMDV